MPATPLPTRFGRYEVLEPLGQGAMGAVYKARDPLIDRLVAVKTVSATLLALPEHRAEFLARFQQEARAAGRLSHPRIVSVFDVGIDQTNGTPYIVMEYVPGVSLATVLHENPVMPVDQALDIVEQIGSALDEAHAQGIVHRDVKPGNVFLDTRGRVKVGDFGIARVEGSELTQTGVGLGTPGYLAPEVLRGAKADARCDLFALGVVAYLLLTGRKPFEGKTGEQVGLQVLQHDPPPPHVVRPEVARHVSEAVMKALAKRPEERTPNVAWFLADLHGGQAATRPATVVVPVGGRRTRRALFVTVLLAGAGLLLGGVLLALRRDAEPEGSTKGSTPGAPSTARPPAPSRGTPATAPAPRAPVPSPSTRKGHEAGEGEKRDDEDRRDKGRGKGHKKKKGH